MVCYSQPFRAYKLLIIEHLSVTADRCYIIQNSEKNVFAFETTFQKYLKHLT